MSKKKIVLISTAGVVVLLLVISQVTASIFASRVGPTSSYAPDEYGPVINELSLAQVYTSDSDYLAKLNASAHDLRLAHDLSPFYGGSYHTVEASIHVMQEHVAALSDVNQAAAASLKNDSKTAISDTQDAIALADDFGTTSNRDLGIAFTELAFLEGADQQPGSSAAAVISADDNAYYAVRSGFAVDDPTPTLLNDVKAGLGATCWPEILNSYALALVTDNDASSSDIGLLANKALSNAQRDQSSDPSVLKLDEAQSYAILGFAVDGGSTAAQDANKALALDPSNSLAKEVLAIFKQAGQQ